MRRAVRLEGVAVDAAEQHHRPVAGLGRDLVGGPVAVGELEVDRRPDALPAPFLAVERAVVQRVEHAPPGVLEAFEEVPLRLVVEQHDVELVVEPGADRLHRGVTAHPRAEQLLVLRQVERHLVAACDEAVAELDHAADAAEPAQMRFDEAETHSGHGRSVVL